MELQTEHSSTRVNAKKTQNASGDFDVEKYLPFVQSIARQVKKSLSAQIEYDDLVSYGVAGLLEAKGRYDPSHGVNFTTFSYYRVRGAIYDGLRKMGWLSRHEYQKIRFGQKATSYLEGVSNSSAKSSNLRTNAADDIKALANQVNHLVTIFVTSLDGLEDAQFEDESLTPQDVKLEKDQLKALVQKVFLKLPKEDQDLIRLYYFKDLSLEAVGRRIGLSKSWTCRRHSQVIDKMTKLLKDIMKDP